MKKDTLSDHNNLSFKSLLVKRKGLATRSFVFIILVILAYSSFNYLRPVNATWYDDAYIYRKKVVIGNSGSADPTSKKVLIEVDTSSLISAGKMQSDCDDTRFVDSNGKVLRHFIDTNSGNCNTSSTDYFVELSSIGAGSNIVYLYYGNSTASSNQSTEFFAPTGKESLGNKLIGNWALDETSGTRYDSGRANTMTDGAGVSYAAGKISNAADFEADSQQYLYEADNSDIAGGDYDFSISAWVYLESNNNDRVIVAKDDTSSREYSLRYSSSLDKFVFEIFDGTNSIADQSADSFGSPSLNTWYFVTAWHDAATDTINIQVNDGSIDTKSTGGGIIGDTSVDFEIGNNRPAVDHFDGLIDNVMFYKKVLSSTERTQLYNSGNGLAFGVVTFPPTSGPTVDSEEQGGRSVLHWRFDEGYGTSANDSTIQANTGSISGATWKTSDMCEFGKCLSFDGSNDYVSKTYSSDTELNPGTGSFTISSWFKHTSSQTGTDTLIARADGVNGVGYKVYMDSSGFICFGIDASAGSFPSDSACSTSSYADSRWHQVTGVKSTTASITLYIDGIQIAQDASITASSISGSSSPFYAGIDADGTSNPWTGFIDEIKVYPYARTAAQIKTDVLNTSSVKGVSTQLGGATQDSLSKGLIGYWKMDETSDGSVQVDRTDSSGNAITLTDNNTTASGVGRFSNGADLEVSNSEHLKTASGLDISSGDQFTVSAWIKRESEGSEMTIINMGSSTQSGVYTFMTGIVRASSNYIYAYMGNQLVGQSANSVISTGTWYQVVWVYNGSGNSNNDRLKLYLNGKLQAITHANTVPSTLTANGTRWCVGCYYSNASGDYFDGIIDEARIYNRALNGNEIQQLYNFAPGPVNYWKFDEKTGVSAYDSTGNGFTGTLTSSPTWTNGKFGGGLSYNNGPYVTAGDISSADWSGLSVGAWVYWDGTTHGGYEGIYNKNSSGDIGRFLISSTGQVLIQNGNGSFASNAAGDVPSNVWSYLSYVYDQNAGKEYIYVNGVQKGSQARSGNITQNANDFLIGWGHVNNTAYTFSGKIDDVKVYNYARTPKQVLEDMNGTHPAGGSPIASQTSYWKFDEGQGTSANDISPNSNTMTLSTATSAWTNAGKYGKAWDGNGSRYVSRADDSDFDVAATDDYAVSLWYKSDSASNPGATEYIVNKANATTAGYAVYANTSGQICFAIDDDTTWTPDVASCTTTDYYDATWHHIFAVRDATTTDKTYLYIDGKFQDSDADSTTATLANSLSLYLADRDGTDNGDEFTGDLDEVKVYRTALTQNEILIDYNSGSSITLGATSNNSTYEKSAANQEYCVPGDTTSCASPVAEWKLDEKTGTTANDTSGNATTGTLASGPTWTTGKIGSAVNFDGSDDKINGFSKVIASTYSISMWVYPIPSSDTYGTLFAAAGGGSGGLYYMGSTRKINVWYSTDHVNNTALTENAWNHITVVSNAGALTFYLNGVADGTATSAPGYTATSIGDDNASETFKGKLDHIRIYDYARTPAQVAWDYNRGKAVATYKFDECSGTSAYDTSGNSFTGTITPSSIGNTTAGSCNSGVSTEMWNDGTNGKLNGSLGFDGTDDYVVISDTSSLRFDSSAADFSLFAWVKRTTTGTEYILSKEDADNDGWRLQFNASNQVLCSEDATDVTSTATITDTNWHHIGCTIDRDGNGQVYIDGSPSGSTVAMGTDAMATTANVRIGTRSYTATNYFNGLIDDVQIFGYALTPSQVKLLLNDSSSVRFGPSSGQP